MARTLVAVGVVLALLFAGAVLLVRGQEEAVPAIDNLLAERLSLEVARASAAGRDLRLADVAAFGWDRVLVADPGASRAQISDALGAPWRGVVAFRTGALLVFARRDGEVVRYTDYRGEGRFAGLPEPVAELSREEAVFSTEGLVLRPVR